jgi:uroporphyrinogen-III decarboxylase
MQVRAMHKMDPMATCPFVAQTLGDLKREVGNQATVLGFVGLPYTLATYLVEGQSSKVRHRHATPRHCTHTHGEPSRSRRHPPRP